MKDHDAPKAKPAVWRALEGVNPLLAPGELVCRWLRVEDEDSKFLLRLFVNLAVYSKIAILTFLAFRSF